MARGPKKHLKRLAAPKHWMLDKLGGVFAVRPRSGPHKLRECLPLNLFLRNRLKYALNYSEVKKIMRQRVVKVDGKIRTDHKFPAGFMDVISIERTNETFRLLYDVKGRYTVHRITAAEGQFKLCKVKALHVAKKNIPYITTNDGRTIRYPDPHIKVNDTVVIDLTSNKITDYVKFEAGNLAMVTGGRNVGRVGVIGHREKLPGAFDIIHIKDAAGHSFATRVTNVFVIGKGNKALEMRTKLWKALNGLICVYKPVDLSISGLKKQIVKRICADGNEVVGMPRLPMIKVPIVEPHETSGALLVVGEQEIQDYTLHPLVCGETFRPEDIRLEEVHFMESTSSGVCVTSVFALNDECDKIPEIQARSWVNNYRLEGIFGRETNKHTIKGRVTLRADYGVLNFLRVYDYFEIFFNAFCEGSWAYTMNSSTPYNTKRNLSDHVTRHRLQKLLARVQSEYRKMAFQAAEVDLQSEAAFEIARKGLPRAQLAGAQIVYKCDVKHFSLPFFALQVQCVGETDAFLSELRLNQRIWHVNNVPMCSIYWITDVEIIFRSTFGPFHVDHALLEKQISLQNIIRNIELCRRIMKNLPEDDPDVVTEGTSQYEEGRDVVDGLDLQVDQEYDAMKPVWSRNYT
ncbi:unnamed protein product [Haemonchus placei]|uniref:Small ribosomal subunit protein eS4 n=1 Tax=Haemonchus placei TaxID=6290 RepID=A0A0N4WIA2_HAEPC|nr:unnamed protein product [Haemonchus placei]